MQWLMNHTLILSGLILLLLFITPIANRLMGVIATYALWALIPISLVTNSLSPWLAVDISHKLTAWTSVKSSLKEVAREQHDWQAQWLSADSMSSVLLGLWLLVALALASYLTWQYLALTRRVETLPIIDNRGSVVIRQSDGQHSPYLIGLKQANIVVPNGFYIDFNQGQQALIIEHELNHFKHRDTTWNLLAMGLVLLFWFNPLMHLAFRRFRQQQELACDAATTINASGPTRTQYAHALLHTVLQQQDRKGYARVLPRAYTALVTSYGVKSQIKDRLTKVMQHRPISRWRSLPGVLIISVVVLMSALAYLQILNTQESNRTPIDRPFAKYPSEASKLKLEGHVTLEFDITKEGHTANIRVVESVPNKVFDKNAMAALEQWRYEAADETTVGHLTQFAFVIEADIETEAGD